MKEVNLDYRIVHSQDGATIIVCTQKTLELFAAVSVCMYVCVHSNFTLYLWFIKDKLLMVYVHYSWLMRQVDMNLILFFCFLKHLLCDIFIL